MIRRKMMPLGTSALTVKPPGKSAVQSFLTEYSADERLNNYVVLNNLIQTQNPSTNYGIKESFAYASTFDHDLISGKTLFSSPQEQNGQSGSPTFAGSAILDEATLTGSFSLAPASLGFDHARVIPNFTDDFEGQAPDVGAQEAGVPAMELGVKAYKNRGELIEDRRPWLVIVASGALLNRLPRLSCPRTEDHVTDVRRVRSPAFLDEAHAISTHARARGEVGAPGTPGPSTNRALERRPAHRAAGRRSAGGWPRRDRVEP